MKVRFAAFAAAMVIAATSAQAQSVINEGFENVAGLTSSGWILANNSTPGGTIATWYQGDQSIFTAQAGTAPSYAAANFNVAGAGGTIANWLITPTFSTALSGTVSLFARADQLDGFADQLRFGFSSGGSAFSDFTLGTAQTIGGDWTQYTFAYAAQAQVPPAASPSSTPAWPTSPTTSVSTRCR